MSTKKPLDITSVTTDSLPPDEAELAKRFADIVHQQKLAESEHPSRDGIEAIDRLKARLTSAGILKGKSPAR